LIVLGKSWPKRNPPGKKVWKCWKSPGSFYWNTGRSNFFGVVFKVKCCRGGNLKSGSFYLVWGRFRVILSSTWWFFPRGFQNNTFFTLSLTSTHSKHSHFLFQGFPLSLIPHKKCLFPEILSIPYTSPQTVSFPRDSVHPLYQSTNSKFNSIHSHSFTHSFTHKQSNMSFSRMLSAPNTKQNNVISLLTAKHSFRNSLTQEQAECFHDQNFPGSFYLHGCRSILSRIVL
jgi:hypothetical protein